MLSICAWYNVLQKMIYLNVIAESDLLMDSVKYIIITQIVSSRMCVPLNAESDLLMDTV